MTELALHDNPGSFSAVGIPLAIQVMDILRGIRARRSDGSDYDDAANLTDAGFTSLEMVKVMLAVEAAFDIMIPAADITPANFATGAAIAATVKRVVAAA
jgi:acyl carrier protein